MPPNTAIAAAESHPQFTKYVLINQILRTWRVNRPSNCSICIERQLGRERWLQLRADILLPAIPTTLYEKCMREECFLTQPTPCRSRYYARHHDANPYDISNSPVLVDKA